MKFYGTDEIEQAAVSTFSKPFPYTPINPEYYEQVEKIYKEILTVCIEDSDRFGDENLQERDRRLEMHQFYDSMEGVETLTNVLKGYYKPEFDDLNPYEILLQVARKKSLFDFDEMLPEMNYKEAKYRAESGEADYHEVPLPDWWREGTGLSKQRAYEMWLGLDPDTSSEPQHVSNPTSQLEIASAVVGGANPESSVEEISTIYENTVAESPIQESPAPAKTIVAEDEPVTSENSLEINSLTGGESEEKTEELEATATNHPISIEKEINEMELTSLNNEDLTAGAKATAGEQVAAKPTTKKSKPVYAGDASLKGANEVVKSSVDARAAYSMNNFFNRILCKSETTAARLVDSTKGILSDDADKAKAAANKIFKNFCKQTGYIEGIEEADPTKKFPYVFREDLGLAEKMLEFINVLRTKPTDFYPVFVNTTSLPVACGIEFDGQMRSNIEMSIITAKNAYDGIYGVGQFEPGTGIGKEKACFISAAFQKKKADKKKAEGGTVTLSAAQATYVPRLIIHNRREYMKDASKIAYLYPTADKSQIATGEVTKTISIVAAIDDGKAASIRVQKFLADGSVDRHPSKTVNGKTVEGEPKYKRFAVKLHTDVMLTSVNPDKQFAATPQEALDKFKTSAIQKGTQREGVVVNLADAASYKDSKVMESKLGTLEAMLAIASEGRLEGFGEVPEVAAAKAKAFNEAAEEATKDAADAI